MLLTDAQLHEIRQIIEDHHNAFVVNVISPEAVEASVLQRLKDLGMVDTQVKSVEDAYLLGQVLAAIEDPRVSKMSYSQFQNYIRKNPIPLSNVERRAVQIAQHTAAQYAVGLGNRVNLEVGQALLTEDAQLAQEMRDTIRTATAEAVARRNTAAQLKSTLGWETKDWARDWDRIAITELHNAKEHGVADNIAKKHGGGQRVAKLTMPDACEHCQRLHIGPDGQPRIFRLSDLEKNGTNFKVKAGNWKAVVGSVHPHCCPEGTRVLTRRGSVPIEQVCVGDQVLSHDSKWHPVLGLDRRVSQQDGVELRGTDWRLVCTNDHPVYRGGDWVAAAKLQEGDHVVNEAVRGDFVFRNESKKDQPPGAKQEIHLLRIFYGVLGSGMPVTAVDLDGDLFLHKGQVDVVDVRWVLEIGNKTLGLESSKDHQFLVGVRTATLRCGDLESVFQFAGRTPNGSICGACIPLTLFGDQLRVSGELSLTGGPGVIPGFQKSADDHLARDMKLISYRLDREEVIEVQLFHELRGDVSSPGIWRFFAHPSCVQSFGFPRELAHAESGPLSPSAFKAQRIQATVDGRNADMEAPCHFGRELQVLEHGVQHGIVDFDCHCSPIVARQSVKLQGVVVYNLTVAGAESFFAEGVLVHNCQCTLIRIPDGWGFDEDGHLSPTGTLGVEYGSREDLEMAVREELDLVKSAKEGHIMFQGLPITIENDTGTVREWTDDMGNKGSTVMLFAYGYLDDTDSMDNDELDVFIGPDPRAANAFIVHQQNPRTGIYDEEKVLLGFANEQQATQAYRFHFDKPEDYLLTVTPMAMDQFKRWAASSEEPDVPAEQAERECRFIIPLRKAELATESGHVATECVDSRAGDRAPGPQLGVNYVFPVPQRDEPPAKMEDEDLHLTPRQMLDQGRHRRNSVKRDKRDYEYRYPLGSVVKPMEIPDSYRDFIVLDEEEAERRKEHLITEGLKNIARPQNKVEVGSKK